MREPQHSECCGEIYVCLCQKLVFLGGTGLPIRDGLDELGTSRLDHVCCPVMVVVIISKGDCHGDDAGDSDQGD